MANTMDFSGPVLMVPLTHSKTFAVHSIGASTRAAKNPIRQILTFKTNVYPMDYVVIDQYKMGAMFLVTGGMLVLAKTGRTRTV